MNKAYRLIWNLAKDAWIIVAENVSGKGGPPPLTRTASRTILLTAAALALGVASTHALPTAPQIISGTASFATSGSALNVTNSNNAIINWQGFSIGQGESTRFIQPSTSCSSASGRRLTSLVIR